MQNIRDVPTQMICITSDGTNDVDILRDGVLDRGSIPLTSTMLAWLNGRAADL